MNDWNLVDMQSMGARIAAEPDGALQVVQHFERHLAQWRAAQPLAAQPPAAQPHTPPKQQQLPASRAQQQPEPPGEPRHAVQHAAALRNGAMPAGRSSSNDGGSCCNDTGRDAVAEGSPFNGSRSLGGAIAAAPAAHASLCSSSCCSLGDCGAAAPAALTSPGSSARSLDGCRVVDSSGATGQPHVVCVRASSSLMDDIESGWSSSRSLQVHLVRTYLLDQHTLEWACHVPSAQNHSCLAEILGGCRSQPSAALS